jgi:uncharacterized protein YgbK (DUF1537 family)
MMYKFINENSIRACPTSGYANGRGISNLPRYLANNPEIAKAEGYKPLVVEEKPVFNNKTQYLTAIYENTTDVIIQRWVVNDVEQPSVDVKARIAELEAEIQSLKEEVQNDITS